MTKSTIGIKDKSTRDAIDEINKRLDRIESIPQLPSTTTVKELTVIVNKITNSIKRNR